jgi:predicted  nucleic acid-binding Zn-ribbon protein
MKFNFNIEKAEITGIADLGGINISVDVEADESITFLKQLLPLAKEIRANAEFTTERNFNNLCKELNEANDKANELKRAKDIIEAEKARLAGKVESLDSQLKEARSLAAKVSK